MASVMTAQTSPATMAPKDPRLARCVLVANQKGGVGKSSIVAAMAAMTAGPTRRVLVVDADQQANATVSDLGVTDTDRGRSLSMAIQYGEPLTPVRDVRPGLDADDPSPGRDRGTGGAGVPAEGVRLAGRRLWDGQELTWLA